MTTTAANDQLLARAQAQWQFGDWQSLIALYPTVDSAQLQNHPDQAELAFYAAVGHLQMGSLEVAEKLFKKTIFIEKKKCVTMLLASAKESLLKIRVLNGDLKNSWGAYKNQWIKNKGDGLGYIDFIFLILRTQKNFPLRIIKEGYEAIVYKKGTLVIKLYKPSSFRENIIYKKSGDGFFAKSLSDSEIFPNVVFSTDLFIVMEYSGEPLGSYTEVTCRNFDPMAFEEWLLYLREELNRLEIIHRDIQPSNILYNKSKKKFFLIDFGWALRYHEKDKLDMRPKTLNPFAKNDEEAISKLIAISRSMRT